MSEVQLKRVRYTHDAMIDLVISQPGISQNEIAAEFGYQPSWVSIVFNSDAFQLRLAERKAELVDPILRASIDDRLRAATNQALEGIIEKLAANAATLEEMTKIVSVTSRALGYGVRQPDQKVDVTQYVAFLPPAAESSAAWQAQNVPAHPATFEMEVDALVGTTQPAQARD
jgi:hypothetical protein